MASSIRKLFIVKRMTRVHSRYKMCTYGFVRSEGVFSIRFLWVYVEIYISLSRQIDIETYFK